MLVQPVSEAENGPFTVHFLWGSPSSEERVKLDQGSSSPQIPWGLSLSPPPAADGPGRAPPTAAGFVSCLQASGRQPRSIQVHSEKGASQSGPNDPQLSRERAGQMKSQRKLARATQRHLKIGYILLKQYLNYVTQQQPPCLSLFLSSER